MTQSDKIKELLNQAQQGTKAIFDSDHYQNYLKVMSRFHNYSARNSLLIWLQKPNATYVAGFQAWKKNFNRQVQKGEKGIAIMGFAPKKIQVDRLKKDEKGNPIYDASGKPITEKGTEQIPAYIPVYVWDISQTAGEPLPELIHELEGNTADFELLMSAIKEISPIPIFFEDITSGAKGYFSAGEKKIVIKTGMSNIQTLKTAIHEITHANLHAPEKNLTLREPKDRATKEVEAESTAFVVCNHYGIDTSDYSFPYLASWSSSKELKELQSSLDTIQAQAGELIDKIDTRFTELKKEKEQTLFTEITAEQGKELITCFENGMDCPAKSYLFNENGKWTALDNRSRNCWVETFPDRLIAIDWLSGKFEMSEYLASPDRSITKEQMIKYGFNQDHIFPLNKDMARKLITKNVPILKLYSDNSYERATNIKDIVNHANTQGIFGISQETWERQQYFDNRTTALAQKYDAIIGIEKTARRCHPFEIEDSDKRLTALSNRIAAYDVESLNETIEDMILRLNGQEKATAEQLYNDLSREFHQYTQDRLAVDLDQFGGEPVIYIKWSENSALEKGQIYPLHRANDIFVSLDNDNLFKQGYDKTSFYIKYKYDGEYSVYEGRQDFGDGDGNIINHIKKTWEYELTSKGQVAQALYGSEKVYAHAEEVLNKFIPFLEAHDTLGRVYEHSNSQLDALNAVKELGATTPGHNNLVEYHSAMLAFVKQYREAINNSFSQLPKMPERSDYQLDNISDIDLSPEYLADLKELKNYRDHVESEISQEAFLAGISPDQYVASGSVPPADRICRIYQLKSDESTKDFRFQELNTNNLPTLSHYDLVYETALAAGTTLDDIFTDFNINRPDDFKGRSLAVSDLISIEWNGTCSANYINPVGFTNIPEIAAEIMGKEEELSLVNNEKYLHLQQCETGWDFSFYDKNSLQFLDGGQYDNPDLNILAARDAILLANNLPVNIVEKKPLSLLDSIDDAQQIKTVSQKEFCHFYYDNNYLFTVTGRDSAQRIYNSLCQETGSLGYCWSDSGKAYFSSIKEASLLDTANPNQQKTGYVPFAESLYKSHIEFLHQNLSRSKEEQAFHASEVLDSVKFDGDIDLDREKTREQLGFKNQDKADNQPPKKMSLKERMAAAQITAEQRNSSRSSLSPDTHKERG